ncbi:MAG: C4-dicarboxylate ABC transporter substrate-binding protein [Rothia sp. (in: high G+C Gram-positive bacteria)]|nr:C4-dicarboxylate ABC transporter substrate-binding protein [Rothia sp. (in: high G+C Gram-positive bacteria)]
MRFSRKLATVAIAALAFTGLAAPAASAYNYAYDSDGDRLLDIWEIEGYDYNGDGYIDIDFPALGADPYHKDIFVEMDYMPGLMASEAELDTIVDTFAQMPLWNPDGRTGINLHLDAGSIYPRYDLGGGNQVPHQGFTNLGDVHDLRAIHSDIARYRTFHYMIWGDYHGTNGSSGAGNLNGRVFTVTVGPTHWGHASSPIRIGTFIHELGHNLGLEHGGDDSVNYKPNYTSIMNYKYQLEGLRRSDGSIYYGYSTSEGMTMNEAAIIETRGIGQQGRGFSIRYGNRYWNAHQGIDFDGDGRVESRPQRIDINKDGRISQLSAPNDMEMIQFQPQHFFYRNASTVEVNEMTADKARDMGYLPAE